MAAGKRRRWVEDTLFTLGIGALFTHELDAMTHAEWRLLPLLSGLTDAVARPAFVAAHVPLFAGLIAAISARSSKLRGRSRAAVSAFLVVHGLLHLLLSNQPDYGFHTWLARILIYGGAACGLLHLATVVTRQRRRG